MNNNCDNNRKAKGKNRNNVKREQPRKDSRTKRINLDNARESKVERDIRRDSQKTTANDIQWYSRNPELLRSSASLPFAKVLGAQVAGNQSIPVPGIMKFVYSPTLGSNMQILNQCANQTYSYLVHANSRNYNYDAPDLMLLIAAGTQVFSIIGSMMRAYGAVKYYQERNMYVPDPLIQAMGFNPTDLRRNLGRAWFDINNLVDQSKQIWIPNTMPIVDRWFWLNTSVFSDAEGDVAQLYLFVQDNYWMLSEKVSTGTALVPLQIDGTVFNPAYSYSGLTWEQWVNAAQTMINQLINSQDRGIIFGDILNAYGSDKIRALQPIPADFVVGPTYNMEVLMQIENITLGGGPKGYIQDVDNNVIVPLHLWDRTTGYTMDFKTVSNPILNFHVPSQPSPEMVVVATRAMAAGQSIVQANYIKPDNTIGQVQSLFTSVYGTEVVQAVVTYKYKLNGSNWELSISNSGSGWAMVSYPSGTNNVGPTAKWSVDWCADLSSFDWHPFVYITPRTEVTQITDGATNGAPTIFSGVIGDLDNFIRISDSELEKLHNMALFSLLGVPVY